MSNSSASFSARARVRLVTALEAGDNVVRASILDGTPAGLETQTFLVSTVSGAIDVVVSTVSAQSPVEADGVKASTVNVVVRDAYGNPLEGVVVDVSATGSAVVTDPAAATRQEGGC